MHKPYYAAFTATSSRASRISAVAKSVYCGLPYEWAFMHTAWRLPEEPKPCRVTTRREVCYDD